MTLRARLLVVIVVLNLAVVGVVQLAALWVHRKVTRDQHEVYGRLLLTAHDYGPAEPDEPDVLRAQEKALLRWVRKLLSLESFRWAFRDLLVTGGGPAGTVDLNPLGTLQRDPRTFPLEDVRAGVTLAMREQRVVNAAHGFCVPIAVSGQVAAAAWCLPKVELAPMPFWWFALPVAAGAVLLAWLLYLGLGRSLVRPLRGLGAAAARVGAGELGVTVERVPRAPELDSLIDAFNAMSAKVAGHTEELRSEVQRATEEAARRERAMVVSSRLAAMGTLAAGIAHEINNPIGGMQNAVRRLQQREGLDERARTYLELIREGLERVQGIARRVLDFSPRQLEARPFSLGAAVDGARALVEHRLHRQGVELQVELPPDLPPVVGERHEIQQVLLNFFLNSLDALEGQPPPCRLRVAAAHQGEWLLVHVDDNGPGVDPTTLARVLDPFFSAKSRPDATGLGLFISYSIVKNHGGEMEVESSPGQGFHIRLRLPVQAPPVRAPLA